MIRRDPPAGRTIGYFTSLIERRFESVATVHADVEMRHVVDRRDDDLWSKGKGAAHHPGGKFFVGGAVRGSAGGIVVKFALNAIHHPLCPPRAVGGSDAPAVLPVSGETAGIVNCVCLVDIRCLPAVFEIVRIVLEHEPVADTAKIDPKVGKLMRKQWAGVEDFAPVNFSPLIG